MRVKLAKYAFGAELVEVRIHARTHVIRVPRVLGAFAAGRIMNTRTAHSQLMGGLIWGVALRCMRPRTSIHVPRVP
jgi:xanthine dehydrogenase YagR molybdenum-binding subunit